MSEHHVLGAQGRHPVDPAFVTFDCPPCGRHAENSPLLPEELDASGQRTVFCGRWGCDALLHVHATVRGEA